MKVALKGRFGKLIAFKIGCTKFSFRGQNAYGCFKWTNEKNDNFCETQKLGDGYRLMYWTCLLLDMNFVSSNANKELTYSSWKVCHRIFSISVFIFHGYVITWFLFQVSCAVNTKYRKNRSQTCFMSLLYHCILRFGDNMDLTDRHMLTSSSTLNARLLLLGNMAQVFFFFSLLLGPHGVGSYF